MNLLTFLSQYPIWTVILITVASIIIILKIIEGCKKLWQKRQDFQNAAEQRGEAHQRQEDAQTHEKEDAEKRLRQLEDNYKLLSEILAKQQQTLDLLMESDELDIKTWIKTQHDQWMPTGYIDSQILDLVCQRFEIYEREGGNSWAKKMVDDMKELTIVTNVPLH